MKITTTKKEIGEWIRLTRKKKLFLSQVALAKKIGKTSNDICQYEHGHNMPPCDVKFNMDKLVEIEEQKQD